MSEMTFEQRFEETVGENAKLAGEAFRAVAKAAKDDDNDSEGFLRAVYVGALSGANTRVRRALLNLAR